MRVSTMTHLRCISWSVAGALLGWSYVAFAQDPSAGAHVAAGLPVDPTAELLTRLLQGGGLPAVLALIAWWARGQLSTGIPVVVRLSDEDRELIRAAALRDPK